MTKKTSVATRFMVVTEPYSLLWPESVAGDTADRFRGKAGYIVDANAPQEDSFLAGQLHKLHPMTDAEVERFEKAYSRKVVASAIKLPQALVAIAAANAGVPFEPLDVAAKVKANEDAAAIAAEADALGIPDPEPADAEWGDA